MTTRDDVLAALDSYTATERAAAVAPVQQLLDAADDYIAADVDIITALQSQLAAATAPKPTVLYGANIGGWKSLGETATAAHARIKAGFGGRLPAIRVWSLTSGGLPTSVYLDGTCKSYVIELNVSMPNAVLNDAMRNAIPGTWFVAWHEPEDDGVTIATWRAFITRVGEAKQASGRTDIHVAVCLMGGEYSTSRYASDSPYPWDQWIPNPLPPGVDAIGGDLYPRGADDQHADAAETVVGPALAAAQAMGVPFVVGEFGCGTKNWSDTARALYTLQAAEIFDESRFDDGTLVFPVVCVYESSQGAAGPWCILPAPDGTGGYPRTVEVVKARMAAS